jgi:hypothetical protein
MTGSCGAPWLLGFRRRGKSWPSHHLRQDATHFAGPPIRELQSGFWILDSGFCILQSGFWILDSAIWILQSGFCNLQSGFCNLRPARKMSPGLQQHVLICGN